MSQTKTNTPHAYLETPRLILRQWQAQDLPAFIALHQDPEVMRYYPRLMNESESKFMFEKMRDLIAVNGWGFWAVEAKQDHGLVGLMGLNEPIYDLPVTPCVEIGWRFAKRYWGKGLATEAASVCLDFAFKALCLPQVYAFTARQNIRSLKLMQRLGMSDLQHNFLHP